MNQDKLSTLLSLYKEHFSTNWEKENYKWVAVKQFQDNWDIDATDFYTMLDNSLKETDNLLTSAGFFPKLMILRFAEKYPSQVRKMFRTLFDETKPLAGRIKSFQESSDKLMDSYGQAGHHYQNENTISIYLWLRYPEKYYIYKYKVCKNVISLLDAPYKIKKGESFDNLTSCFALYNDIQEVMLRDNDLKTILREHIGKNHYKDTKLHTAVTDFCFFITKQTQTTDDEQKSSHTSGGKNYWWLNANPKIWQFSTVAVGQEESYTVYNEGHPRRIHQNFLDAKPGDIVIGYQASPTKQITAICEITRSQDGNNLYFKKTQDVDTPVDYKTLQNMPELSNMQFFQNPNGSLFKLTQEEYEAIMRKINNTTYTKQDFLNEVFMTEEKYDDIVALLERKKNIILQGAPGVGKTYAAKRLAYSIIGQKDESRIKMVQFHQNYAYEDFVLGYKPNGNGFELKTGIFYNFCTVAAQDPDQPYFFIIDEINRGNLSKIFGELLMMIEPEYRGKSVTLAYTDEPFIVPRNVYIIGMMNTADRSLALIDYALRRRFGFVGMEPGFDSVGFQKYLSMNQKLAPLVEAIQTINQDIAKDPSLGPGFCIGHSYLCPTMGSDKAVNIESIITYDLIPLIEEYWFDNDSKKSQHINTLKELLK